MKFPSGRQETRGPSTRSPAGNSGTSTPFRAPARSDTTRGWTTAGDTAPAPGPAANYWGGDRPGNNLFGNSIVAVDIVTGAYKWHFQTVHHDIWDIDMSAAPGLVDVKFGG